MRDNLSALEFEIPDKWEETIVFFLEMQNSHISKAMSHKKGEEPP